MIWLPWFMDERGRNPMETEDFIEICTSYVLRYRTQEALTWEINRTYFRFPPPVPPHLPGPLNYKIVRTQARWLENEVSWPVLECPPNAPKFRRRKLRQEVEQKFQYQLIIRSYAQYRGRREQRLLWQWLVVK